MQNDMQNKTLKRKYIYVKYIYIYTYTTCLILKKLFEYFYIYKKDSLEIKDAVFLKNLKNKIVYI